MMPKAILCRLTNRLVWFQIWSERKELSYRNSDSEKHPLTFVIEGERVFGFKMLSERICNYFLFDIATPPILPQCARRYIRIYARYYTNFFSYNTYYNTCYNDYSKLFIYFLCIYC